MLGRLKFEIEDLVKKQLDLIPLEVWQDETSTFLDPSLAGGQFVNAIEKRLAEYGHSADNISSRVFGFESNSMRVNFARNKYNLLGQYEVADFLEKSIDQKFTVIVGNPPFKGQRDHGKKTTGDGEPWVHYTTKAFNLVEDNGYLGLTIPDSWTAPTYDMMGSRISIFEHYFKKCNLIYVDLDVKKYFGSVGTTPTAFLLKKDTNYVKTKLNTSVEEFDIDITNMSFIPRDCSKLSISIHQKILHQALNKRQFKMRWTKSVTKTKVIGDKDDIHCYPVLDSHCYKPIRWGDRADPDLTKRKVLLPYVGAYQVVVDDKGELGAKEQVSIMFLKDDEQGEFAKNYYESKLVKFVMNSNKWTQYILSQILNYIPINDFTQNWTDDKIYKMFNLTQEEIGYIESKVVDNTSS